MALTQRDLDKIGQIVDNVLVDAIKNLPTKNDFYTKMDEVMRELKTI